MLPDTWSIQDTRSWAMLADTRKVHNLSWLTRDYRFRWQKVISLTITDAFGRIFNPLINWLLHLSFYDGACYYAFFYSAGTARDLWKETDEALLVCTFQFKCIWKFDEKQRQARGAERKKTVNPQICSEIILVTVRCTFNVQLIILFEYKHMLDCQKQNRLLEILVWSYLFVQNIVCERTIKKRDTKYPCLFERKSPILQCS